MKKIRKLVEEHLSQKDVFEEDDELAEDSLVKSTVNDLLEGNIDDATCENLGRNFQGLKTKEFPLEDTFSSKAYSGKRISRKSLNRDSEQDDRILESDSDAYITREGKKNGGNSSSNSDDEDTDLSVSADESAENEEVTFQGDDSNVTENEIKESKKKSSKLKKSVKFMLPSDDENTSDEDISDENDQDVSNDDESEIEDDLSDEENAENNSSFLYSKHFKNEPSEIERGIAIQNQLSMWEVLLESRIMLQKCLVVSNKLPQPKIFDEVLTQFSVEDKDIMIDCKEKVWDLLEKLILIQDKLRKQSSEYTKSKTSDPESENIDDDYDDTSLKVKRRKLTEYPEILEKQYSEYMPFRDGVIQKWNDRTKIASGKWAKSNFSAFDQPVLKQIEQIMNDKHRLIQKTFMKRSQYSIIGENTADNLDETNLGHSNVEMDREIFDDDDFYHKLLRDYIERKTTDISDPAQLGRRWIQLQSLRNKSKRKIDTRRTKGRKVKFDVHPKLVNFMAPVVVDRWEDQAINELYRSVFGKNLINT